jgi:hypothetical protein
MIVISNSSTGYNPVLACIISTSYFTLRSFSTHLPFFVVDHSLVLAGPRKAKAITASDIKYLWRETQQTNLVKDTPFAFAFAPILRKNRSVHIASLVNLSSPGYFALSLPDSLSAPSHESAWQSLHRLRRHLCCHYWNGMKAQYIAGWCTLGYLNMKMSYMVSYSTYLIS